MNPLLVPYLRFVISMHMQIGMTDNGGMHMADGDKLRIWLEGNDRESLEARIERLRFLEAEFGEGKSLLFYGTTPGMVFDEARLCYLNGLFISCILVSEAIIEQSYAGVFHMARAEKLEDRSFSWIVNKAYEDDWINKTEHDTLLKINVHRNSIAHFRRPDDPRHPVYQALTQGKDVWEMLRDDAKAILHILFQILNRSPFRIG